MKRSALFSPDRSYRYDLWRTWDDAKRTVVFIGLNPSTANENEDDATVRRCIAFAATWGYGSLCMLNLFAYCATDPAQMKRAADPIGASNNGHILDVLGGAGLSIAAWGVHGEHLGRDRELLRLIPWRLHCLGMTKDGHPRHPLYLSKLSRPAVFKTAA